MTYVNLLFSHEYILHILFFLAQVLIPYKSIGTAVTLWAYLWFEFCLCGLVILLDRYEVPLFVYVKPCQRLKSCDVEFGMIGHFGSFLY